MRTRISLIAVIALLLIACNRHDASAEQRPAASAPSPILLASPALKGLPTLAPVLVKVFPAVVSISVQGTKQVVRNPLLQDPFFRRFFDLPDQPPTERFLAVGSGVITDAGHGYIVTNNHLVESAQQIRVTLKDRSQYVAKLVGADPPTDIAVLKIDAPNLTALPMGLSRELNVGDYVVAVGNPFGVGQTATFGIVSALGRTGLGIESYEDFIQTDASINPGNSGGALINMAGQLVGMNTAILSRSGGNVGVGFAIPVDVIATVTRQLIDTGKVSRGAIGVAVQDLTPLLARAMGISVNSGALVSEVMPNTAASAAALQPGDVITGLNGQPVTSGAYLRNAVGQIKPGTNVRLAVLRDGREREFELTLQPASERRPAAEPKKTEETPPLSSGLKIGPIPQSDPHYGKLKGVAVQSVEPGSPAANAGIREGDLIVSVDRKPVETPEDYARLERAHAPDRPMLIEFRRGDLNLFSAIEQ